MAAAAAAGCGGGSNAQGSVPQGAQCTGGYRQTYLSCRHPNPCSLGTLGGACCSGRGLCSAPGAVQSVQVVQSEHSERGLSKRVATDRHGGQHRLLLEALPAGFWYCCDNLRMQSLPFGTPRAQDTVGALLSPALGARPILSPQQRAAIRAMAAGKEGKQPAAEAPAAEAPAAEAAQQTAATPAAPKLQRIPSIPVVTRPDGAGATLCNLPPPAAAACPRSRPPTSGASSPAPPAEYLEIRDLRQQLKPQVGGVAWRTLGRSCSCAAERLQAQLPVQTLGKAST